MKYINNKWTGVILLCTIALSGLFITGFIIDKINEPEPMVRAGKSYTPAMASNVTSRTLNTAFMVSDQRASIVSYNTLISVAATIVLANSGQVVLQTKTGAGAWTNISSAQFTVGAGLSFNSSCTVSVFGVVGRADSVKVISNNLVGTPTYGQPAGIEILIN